MPDTAPIPKTAPAPKFVGDGRIEWIEKPVPEPGSGQLLTQVKANALCGSERGQFRNGCPITPGHEAAGVVMAAGPDTTIAVGTPGVVFLMDFCGKCRSCQRGATNQCLAKRADMGFSHDGGYGAYELIHENIFFPIPHDLTCAEATLLLDIMGTGGHALARGQQIVEEPQSVFIAGAGPIGLGVLAMTRLLFGADIPIVITDRVPYRLELAARLGSTPVSIAEQDVNTVAKSLVENGKFDLALDTTGSGEAIQGAMGLLNRNGALVCIGHGAEIAVNVSRELIQPEAALVGSEYFRFDELPANLERLLQNRDYLGQIITHCFPVQEIQNAFETFFAGKTGKVIIEQ